MPASTRTAETMEDTMPQQDHRPMTTRGRPVTTRGRPMTTKGRRPRQGSVESLSSMTSSGSCKEQDELNGIKNNDEKNDKRLLNRSRAQTATASSSKYHSSCSSSSASSDSLNSSTNSFRSRTLQGYPSPDTIHLTCRVSNDKPGYYEYLRPYSAYTPPMWKEPKLPKAFRDSKKLNHSSLTEGERFYLWRTATVYGLSDMKKQNQLRYEKILRHTVETGFHTEEEVQKYMNYFSGNRKRQFHTDPSVWRAPPRIPVRPLHFRKPPTSPRGWNSHSPQGDLGTGRAQSLKDAPSVRSVRSNDIKNIYGQNQKLLKPKNGRSPRTSTGDDAEDTQQDKTDSTSDPTKQEGENEEQPPPHIYYDMKLKRTVIRPDTGKDGKTNSAKDTKAKDNKVSWKDQNKSKGRKANAKHPHPPPPKISWEDKKKLEEGRNARPKTSRGRGERGEEDANDGRNSAFSTTSGTGSSSSGSSSSGTGSSSTGSSSGSSSSRSSSRSTIKGPTIGHKAWEGDNDEPRVALAESFWGRSKDKSQEDGDKSQEEGESSQASSSKQEAARTSDHNNSARVEQEAARTTDHNNSPRSRGHRSGGRRSSSRKDSVKDHEEGESSQVGSQGQGEYSGDEYDQDSDDARAAIAQAFWNKKKINAPTF